MIRRITHFLVLVLGFSIQNTFAEIPKTISYQGVLTDASGNAVRDGDYSMIFRLYDAADGGSILWEEKQTVAISGSLFDVILGKKTPLDLPFDQTYWLSIELSDDGIVLEPRIELTASAYSLNAASVADSSVTGEKITGGAVVRSINSLTENVRLLAGDNVTITTDDTALVIAAQASGGESVWQQQTDNIFYDSGNVGIGTNAPDAPLHVKGSSELLKIEGGIAQMRFYDPDDLTSEKGRVGYGYFDNKLSITNLEQGKVALATSFTERLVIDAEGNIGMGTSFPSQKVDIVGDIEMGGGDSRFDGNSEAVIIKGQSDTWYVAVQNEDAAAVSDFFIGKSSTEDGTFHIENNGNVGIGTTSPARNLHIREDANDFVGLIIDNRNTEGSSTERISFRNEDGDVAAIQVRDDNSISGPEMSIFNNRPNGHIAWATGGAEKMILSNSGNLGLGTDSPDARLHVAEAVNGSATPTGHVAVIENNAGSTGNGPDVLALKTSAVNPGGNTNFITFFDGDDQGVGRIEGNGAGGVEYLTTGADYAEALPRLHREEAIEEGDIVGVFGGKITRQTDRAEHLMVISSRPAVLGNAPPEHLESQYEKVAFMGQVAIKVRGPVESGDFIVPSGKNDGTGNAVSLEAVDAEQLQQIIGRAWESNRRHGIKLVNALVGLNNRDMVIARQQQKIQSLQKRLERLESRVNQILSAAEHGTSPEARLESGAQAGPLQNQSGVFQK